MIYVYCFSLATSNTLSNGSFVQLRTVILAIWQKKREKKRNYHAMLNVCEIVNFRSRAK